MLNKNFEPQQNTAKALAFSGDLPVTLQNNSLELSEGQNKFRTSGKLAVKPRHGALYPTSRLLLRGQDSNLRPIA